MFLEQLSGNICQNRSNFKVVQFLPVMNQIACPNCGTQIDVNDLLAHQLEEQIQRKYQNELNETRNEFENKQEDLLRETE